MIQPRRCLALIQFVCAMNLPLASTMAESSLQAGAARVDITPTEPVTLAGYESRKEFSKGVHDPISARALAFEQNGKHLVLVSVDSLGFLQRNSRPAAERSSGSVSPATVRIVPRRHPYSQRANPDSRPGERKLQQRGLHRNSKIKPG
jgi:hypothetical protein